MFNLNLSNTYYETHYYKSEGLWTFFIVIGSGLFIVPMELDNTFTLQTIRTPAIHVIIVDVDYLLCNDSVRLDRD